MNPTIRQITALLEQAFGSNALNRVVAVKIYNMLVTNGWVQNGN